MADEQLSHGNTPLPPDEDWLTGALQRGWAPSLHVMLDVVEPIEVVEFAHGPASVVWRRRRHDAHEVHGPELIGVPWWRECAGRSGTDARREYWRVVPVNGPWLWIFRRSSDRRWFMHGLWA